MKTQKGMALLLAATVLASGGQAASLAFTAPSASAAVTDSQVNTAVQQILKETNAARAQAGVKPLTLTTSMNFVAQKWSVQMAADKLMYHNPYFADQIPQNYTAAAENVAAGYSYTQVVTGWLNSPGHRANILNAQHTNIGIGYYVDDAGKTWFTQVFAGYPTVAAPPQIEEINQWNQIRTYGQGFTAWWYENGAHDYKVDVYQGTTLITSSITKEPKVIIDGLRPDTTYTLNITARSTDHTGKVFSSPVRSTTLKTVTYPPSEDTPVNVAAPLPVSYLTVNATNMNRYGKIGIGANWNVPEDYTGFLHYNVVTLKEAGKPDRVIKTASDGLDISDLTENTTYTVEVKAMIVSYDRKEVRYTPPVSKTVKTPYSVNTVKVGLPTNVKISNLKDTSMTTTWTAPAGTVGKITHYSVLVMQGTKTVKNITTTRPTYTFTGLTPGTTYSVGVVAHAVSESGHQTAHSERAAMAAFKTTTVSVAKAAAPIITVSNVTTTSARVAWQKPAVTGTLTGYKIHVKKGTQLVKTYTVSSAATATTIPGLTRNTAYTFVVEAHVKSLDGTSVGKGVSAPKTVTTAR